MHLDFLSTKDLVMADETVLVIKKKYNTLVKEMQCGAC